MSILIFDKAEYLTFYEKLCANAHITFDFVHNYQEFLQKKYEDYLAVLVSGNFANENFASAIQTAVNFRSSLIAFSESALTVDQLRFLQETVKIPFVFNREVEHYEFRGIIALCQKQQSSETDIYSDIRERFKQTIFGKLANINNKISEIKQPYTADVLRPLQTEIELLATRAYAHDYFIVSHLCHAVNQEIERTILHDSKGDLKPILDHFVRKLETGFQLRGIGKGMELEIAENLHQAGTKQADIILIDKPEECDEIAKWALGCGIDLVVTPSDGALKNKTKPSAKIGLLSEKNEESPAQFLRRFKEIEKKYDVAAWGALDFKGNFAERFEAMKAGAKFFCAKNMPLEELFDDLVGELLSFKKIRGKRSRICVLSKEPAFLEVIQTSLASLDCEFTHFKTREALFEHVQKSGSDFVILKEESLNLESIDLMKLIHADFHLKRIPILIVVDFQERNAIETVLFEDNEDWLPLPFSIPTFLSKASSALKRQAVCRHYKSHDPDTQLYTPVKFRDRFHFTAASYIFALIEVDLNQVASRYGSKKRDEVIMQMGRFLKNFFSPNEWIVRWSENEFVLLFEEEEAQVDFLMKSCIQKVQKTFVEATQIETGIHYALAAYTREGTTLDSLYSIASGKMAEIRKAEASQAAIAPKVPEVMLIDPDKGLLELLDESLKLRSLNTCVAKNGGDALGILKNRDTAHLPSLIISERLLEDMDGIEVLNRFRQMFPQSQSIFWFLSVRGSEEDMMRGLQAGAKDYLIKPFNLTLLIEKVNNLLNKST